VLARGRKSVILEIETNAVALVLEAWRQSAAPVCAVGCDLVARATDERRDSDEQKRERGAGFPLGKPVQNER
jgi:hypothetical protein